MNDSKNNHAEGDVDKIVKEQFFPGDQTGRICLEVGAARPDYLSIGALFRSLGWRVLSIEPNPEFYILHKKMGHEVFEYACGDHDEDNVDFYVVDLHGDKYLDGEVSFESFSSLGIKKSYSTLREDLDTKKIKVNLRKLDTILKTHSPEIDHIDLLSVDVEGWEIEVMRGLSVRKYKPQVAIIENLFNEQEYSRYMKNIGYTLWRQIPPNDVYIREGFVDRIKGKLL